MNLSAIQEALRHDALDGWLFFDHHHRDPLAYRVLGLPADAHATRRWYYFIPADGDPAGLLHRIEPNVIGTLPGKRTYYSRWSEQSEGIANLLRGAKRIAMQYSPMCAIPYVSMIDAGTLELVRAADVDVVSSANMVQLFEATWSATQIGFHLEAGRRVDAVRRAAFYRVADFLRRGERITEWQLQRFILDQFADNDLVTDHGPIVAINANASNPHYEPSAEVNSTIAPGDVLLIDLWAKLNKPDAVYYDITWTGVCAETIPEKVQSVFEVVRDARDAAIACVQQAARNRQALKGFQVDDAARGHITKHGFGDFFVHRTGHSIGMEVHGSGANMDNFETHDERDIIPNTCFSIEPGIYLPEFGIRLEVNVLHRGSDAIVTGEMQKDLVKII